MWKAKTFIWIAAFILLISGVFAEERIINEMCSYRQIGNSGGDECTMTDGSTATTSQITSTSPDTLNGTYDNYRGEGYSGIVNRINFSYHADANTADYKLSVYGSNDNFTTIELIYNESSFTTYPVGGGEQRIINFTDSQRYRFFSVVLAGDGSGVGTDIGQDWQLYGLTRGLNFSKQSINNTAPYQNDTVLISMNITDIGNITWYKFSYDNGTGNYINKTKVVVGSTAVNATVNLPIETDAGAEIYYLWYANDSFGNIFSSNVTQLVVAGGTAPTATLDQNNFFNSKNTTIISLNQSATALLNITFADNIDLFAYEFNITNDKGTVFFSQNNQSLNGTTDYVTQNIDVSSYQGFYNVTLKVTDTHTAQAIRDFKVDKSLDTLTFDKQIKITAQSAIWSSTEKLKDRYDFQFRYMPFIAPKTKVFYIESQNPLSFQQDSIYKAHFVDFKAGKWIDFEGIEGTPLVEKISDYRYKIIFKQEGSTIKFHSIGGLNANTYNYQYYLSNVSISYSYPPTYKNVFSSSFFLSFNATGNGRNNTVTEIYDGNNVFVSNFSVQNNGTGAYFYNYTISGLTGNHYYINATHIDINKENTSSKTKEYFKLVITNDTTLGHPAINFTIVDESNGSRIKATSASSITYNSTNSLYTNSNQDNFSLNIYPAWTSTFADYTITYSATGYQTRKFSKTMASFTNATTTQTLYLLADTQGIVGTLQILDQYSQAISGATVTMALSDGTILETRTSDDAGIASFFVNPDTTYTFTVSKSSYTATSVNLRITSTDIRTIILGQATSGAYTSYGTGIQYSWQPRDNHLQNNTLYSFVFNMTSSFWNISDCILNIKNATTLLNHSQSSFNGSQCIIQVNLNTLNQSRIIAEAIYRLNNTINITVTNEYLIQYTYTGQYSLKVFLNDIKNFSVAGFNDGTRLLLAFIAIFLIVAGLSAKVAPLREPEPLIIIIILLVAFFSYIGWMMNPLQTIPTDIKGLPGTWLNQYIIFVLTLVAGIAIIARRQL